LYEGMDKSLRGVFGDDSDNNKGAPVARVRIEYDNAGPALQEAQDFLRKAKILEELRDDLLRYIRKPVDLVLRGASCGANSYGFMYSPTLRQITACYEEVDWFLFGDSDNGAPSKPNASVAGDELGARPRRHPPLQTPPPPPPTPRR
jgi:hypothetical protein